MQSTLFATVVHTCGEQALPILQGCLVVPAEKHIFLCTELTAPLIPRICQTAGISRHDTEILKVSPFDLRSTVDSLKPIVDGDGKKIAFNITGGTKPMSIAALNVALRHQCPSFYIDHSQRRILWLTGDRSPEILPPILKSVEPFFSLGGQSLKSVDKQTGFQTAENRRMLSEHVFASLTKPINKLSQKIIQNRFNNQPGTPFKLEVGPIRASLKESGVANFTADDIDFSFPDMPDFAQYLAGGWFEEYCYFLLKPLEESGEIFDLRLNLKTQVPGHASKNQGKKKPTQADSQEIDLIFTDGYDLFLLEAKSGSVKQEHIQKLENLANKFGGSFGRGFFLSLFPPTYGTFPNRVLESRSVACFAGRGIPSIPSSILNTKPGEMRLN